MHCSDAQQLIDLRVHDPAACDWSSLDAHLATCPACAQLVAELEQTRAMLADLREAGPTPEEVDEMIAALPLTSELTSTWRTMWHKARELAPLLAACVVLAAVLLAALEVGSYRQHGVGPLSGLVPSLSRGATSAPVAAVANERALLSPQAAPPLPPSRGAPPAELDFREVENISYGYEVPESQIQSEPSAGYHMTDVAGDGMAEAGERYLRFGLEATAGQGYRCEDPDAERADDHSGPVLGDQAGKPVLREEFARDQGMMFALKGSDWTPVEKAWARALAGGELASAGRGRAGGRGGSGTSNAQLGAPFVQAEPVSAGLPVVAVDKQPPPPPEAAPPAPAVTPPTEPAATPTPAQRTVPKIIRTGQLALEVDAYEPATQAVANVVSRFDAYIADSRTEEQTGGALAGHIVIRVVPDQFEALFAALKPVGHVESEGAKASDVTDQYVDLEARINGLLITEQRLQELVKSKTIIDKVESLLEVERELTRVRSQVEQLQGQLRVLADRVAWSTITVQLREAVRQVPNAQLVIEVAELRPALATLEALLTTHGGQQLAGRTSQTDQGALRADATIQVHVADFAAALSALEALGRVEDRQVQDLRYDLGEAGWATQTWSPIKLVIYEQNRELPSGWLHLEVAALPGAQAALETVLANHDGRIVTNQTTRQDDGGTLAELTLHVPAGRYAGLVAALEGLGRVTSKNISGEAGRVTGGAAETLCALSLRLKEPVREVPHGGMIVQVERFADARAQLSALIRDQDVQVVASQSEQRSDGTWRGSFRLAVPAPNVEAVVDRLERLGKVEERALYGLGLGELAKLDAQTRGRLEVTLAEPAAVQPEPGRAGASIRAHLRDGLAGLYGSVGLILRGLIVLAPWLLMIVVLAWLWTRLRRRRRSSQA